MILISEFIYSEIRIISTLRSFCQDHRLAKISFRKTSIVLLKWLFPLYKITEFTVNHRGFTVNHRGFTENHRVYSKSQRVYSKSQRVYSKSQRVYSGCNTQSSIINARTSGFILERVSLCCFFYHLLQVI